MNSKIHFVIQSTEIKSGSGYATYQKDSGGFFTLPGIVLGKTSRNNNNYDVNSLVNCMTDPKTRFYRMLTEGNLNGEWGHPMTKDFDRLTKINEKELCLFISKVWTGSIKTGETVVWVKFKPVGPYGKVFEEALEDPSRNANLSIRVACAEGPYRDGVQYLFPKFVVTFDGVGAGGYAEASKRTAIDNLQVGQECYNYIFDEKDLTDDIGKRLVYTENYHKDSVLDYFKAESIKMQQKIVSINKNTGNQSVAFNNLFLK